MTSPHHHYHLSTERSPGCHGYLGCLFTTQEIKVRRQPHPHLAQKLAGMSVDNMQLPIKGLTCSSRVSKQRNTNGQEWQEKCSSRIDFPNDQGSPWTTLLANGKYQGRNDKVNRRHEQKLQTSVGRGHFSATYLKFRFTKVSCSGVIKDGCSQCWGNWEQKCLANFYSLTFKIKETNPKMYLRCCMSFQNRSETLCRDGFVLTLHFPSRTVVFSPLPCF